MIYELNVKRIREQLRQLQKCSAVLEETEKKLQTVTEQFAVERALHIAVECMIDIGNTLIDGFIMRDPGGYHDIVDILEDEQVITKELADKFHQKVDFRDQLVRHYHQINLEELKSQAEDVLLYQEFSQQVTLFLRNEKKKGNILDEI